MSWFFPSPARSETRCSLRLRWRGKEIPDSRFGEDIALVGRIRFQFAPQPIDVYLQHVILTHIHSSPDVL